MSGPPDKFPLYLDLSAYEPGAATATALGDLYTNFWNTYGVWPTVAVVSGTYIYLGAYD
jgi:hypothetical protein